MRSSFQAQPAEIFAHMPERYSLAASMQGYLSSELVTTASWNALRGWKKHLGPISLIIFRNWVQVGKIFHIDHLQSNSSTSDVSHFKQYLRRNWASKKWCTYLYICVCVRVCAQNYIYIPPTPTNHFRRDMKINQYQSKNTTVWSAGLGRGGWQLCEPAVLPAYATSDICSCIFMFMFVHMCMHGNYTYNREREMNIYIYVYMYW